MIKYIFLKIKKYLQVSHCEKQFQSMWPDLAKFRHFGNILKVFGDYVRAFLVLGKNLNLLWSTFYAIGQILIVAYGLILTNK